MNNWTCLKCGNDTFENGEFHVAGGTMSKLFDIQGDKFVTLTCTKCNFTEIYKQPKNVTGNILDFLIGG